MSAILLLQIITVRADNWPQFRGPHSLGISTETGLPVKWSAATNVNINLGAQGLGSGSFSNGEGGFVITPTGFAGVLSGQGSAAGWSWEVHRSPLQRVVRSPRQPPDGRTRGVAVLAP